MKLYLSLIILIFVGILLNIINYNYFLSLLSIVWYIASILIIYLAVKLSIKYKFRQLNIKEMFLSFKSKSKNNITPISSLCLSLAAKIGVGSLSGVALAIYYGGIGTLFWIIIISLLVAINTYIECLLGVKYRYKILNTLVGGPAYYIKKCLGNIKLSKLYSILVILCYSMLFLSVQVNTIVKIGNYFNITTSYTLIILLLISLLIIIKGISIITKVNNKLVPIMLLFYLFIGIYIIVNNYSLLPNIFINVLKEAFNIRSIISVLLIGMQRAIFITESSIGTSAITASMCDNDGSKQGMLEVFGIYITIFIVALITFLIIVTSNYNTVSFDNINGIEILLYSFNYHFGSLGIKLLSIITILFALSTIISGYYFGDTNTNILSNKKEIKLIYKVLFLLVIAISCYIKPKILWNLTDYFVAILAIINVTSIIKINKHNYCK